MPVHVRLLGRFSVALSDGRVLTRRRVNDRVLRMLQLLAVRQGQAVSTVELARELWGAEPAALPRLRKTAQRVRRLDPAYELIVNVRGGYAVDMAEIDLDVVELERRRGQMLAAQLRGDLPSARRKAAELVSGFFVDADDLAQLDLTVPGMEGVVRWAAAHLDDALTLLDGGTPLTEAGERARTVVRQLLVTGAGSEPGR